MYDTVKIVKTEIDFNDINKDQFRSISDINNNVISANRTIRINEDDKSHSQTIYLSYIGKYRSLSATFSIPNLLYGSNIYEFNLEEDKNRLLTLLNYHIRDIVNVDVRKWRISRLDICKNIELDIPTQQVIHSLIINSFTQSKSKGKKTYNSAVVFNDKTETFQIYDKIESEKHFEYEIPESFEDKNILRIENQIKNNEGLKAPLRFGKELKLKDIFKPQIVRKSKQILLENFYRNYGNIIIKNDLISIGRDVEKEYGNKGLFEKVVILNQFKNEIINLDELDRLFKVFYSKRQLMRKRNELRRLYDFYNNNIALNTGFNLYDKVKSELGVK